MKKILVTGGTGFIGKPLCALLKNKGFDVWVLSRKARDLTKHILHWNPDKGEIDDLSKENFQAVIHLAGEAIAGGIWTEKYKKKLVSSRVDSTRLLVSTLLKCENPPKVLLSSSGIGIYGDRGDELLDESAETGIGFLADLAKNWEKEALAYESPAQRVVLLRTGLVLGAGGGIFQKLAPFFKWGLGGRLGSGEQYLSWIHLEDFLRAVDFLLQKEAINGPVHMVSPTPIINYEFTKILAKKVKRPAFFRVPQLLLSNLPGSMGSEIFLASQKCIPSILSENDFTFKYVSLESAFDHLLSSE